LVVCLALVLGGTALAQPVISNVQAGNITASSAVITWTTDELANSLVVYGNTTPPTSTASDGSYVTDHVVTLTDLTANTQYFYEVRSANQTGYFTIDNNGGSYYTFTTLEAEIHLRGWVWCSNFGPITDATFDGSVTMVDRGIEAPSSSLHVVGDLTIERAGGNVTVSLDMYGSRVRSLFYLREEAPGKSVSLTGSWIDADGGEYYILTSGTIGLPNPEGAELKTGKLCFVMLRTPDVEVPLPEGDGFVADVESIVTRFTRLIDRLWDSLATTDFRGFLSSILSQIAVIIAAIRDALGGSYIP